MQLGRPIKSVTYLQAGDHICCLYETEEEHRAVLTPFLRQGLEQGEKVLYIGDAPTSEIVLGYLQKDGMELDSYLSRGQLSILSVSATYLLEGVFDPDRMISLLRSETDRALAEGYSALRVTSEMKWVLRGLTGSERLMEYEVKLDEFFPGSRCLAICQYDRRRFAPELLLEVLGAHPVVIAGTEYFSNVYYIAPEHFLSPNPAAAKLQYQLNQLKEIKHANEARWETEGKYRLLVKNLPSIVFRGSKDYAIQLFDDKIEAFTGYGVQEFNSGRIKWSDLIIAEDLQTVKDNFIQALKTDRSYVREYRIKAKAGNILWVQERSQIVCDENGEIEYVDGLFFDITERKLAENTVQRQRDQLAAHGRILDSILSGTKLAELADRILDEVLALLQVEYGAVYLVQGKEVALACWRAFSAKSRAHMLCFTASDPPPWIRELHVIHNLLDGHQPIPQFAKQEGIQAWVTIPLVVPSRGRAQAGEWLGSIIAASRIYEKLDEEHIGVLRCMADELALAVEHVRADDAAQQRLIRLQTLRDIDRAIVQSFNLKDVLHVVLERVPRELGADGAAISLFEEEQAGTKVFAMRLPNGTFIDEEAFSLAESLLHWYVDRQEPVIIHDLRLDPRVQMYRKRIVSKNLVSYLGLPLIVRKRTIGILHILTTQPKVFAEDDVEFFTTMAGQAAIAIQNVRLFEETRCYAGQLENEMAEVKRVQEALRESEEIYRSLTNDVMDSSAVGIFILDRDFKVVWVNRALERYLGLRRDDVIGKDKRELIRERIKNIFEFPELFAEKVFATYHSNTYIENFECHVLPQGKREERWLEHWSQPIRSGLYAGGRIEHYTDITWRKRAEEQKDQLEEQLWHAQKMETVGTLAGGIAHDFNNVLQTVEGFAELLLLGRDMDDSQRQDLQEIVRAAIKGSELTRQLLTFSRRIETRRRPLDLNYKAKHVSDILERTIPKMIEVEFSLADELRAVNGDPVQIEQVIMNLAVNARDAMPEGGRLVIKTENVVLDEAYCKTHEGARPGDYVLLSISDTGHGMDKETLEHVFEPFYSTKGIDEGTGLGLAIVYGIVKGHDGYITCHSESGAGTTFEVYFPIIQRGTETLEPQEPESAVPRGSETILLVDDEQSIRSLGKRILRNLGYTVLTAADGERALELYRKERRRIDLVILDLVMPGMGGGQCLEEILKIDPQAKVIIATGYSVNGPTEKAIEAGARASVSKPFKVATMARTLREVLDEGT